MFITNPNNQLSTFEDVIDTFKRYKDGGFWVKKIIQHLGVFQESVLGPYTHKEAVELSKRWERIFKFEGKKVAKALSFKDLVCSKKEILEVDEKWRWNPPPGSGLICLMKGYYKVSVYSYEFTKEKDFEKFYEYVEENGVRRIDLKNIKNTALETKNISVFYNENSVESYRRGHIMARFLRELSIGEKEYIDWIMDTIRGVEPDVKKPILIPGYVENINKECYPVDLDFFKEEMSNGHELPKIFKKLWKCTPPDNKGFVFTPGDENIEEKWDIIEVDLVIGSSSKLHRLLLERYHKNFNIILTDYENSFSIGLYDIDFSNITREAEMTVRLPGRIDLDDEEILYISQTLRDGRFFTKIDVIGSVLLFISKCVGLKTIYINDKHLENCDSEVALFINPVRFLANYGSIYSNLGFKNSDPELLDKIITLYQRKNIPILDMVDEKDVVNEMNIESISKLYMDKACVYENICEVLSTVSSEISERISNQYILNLEDIELSYYKNFF